jgi:hypothetical protein
MAAQPYDSSVEELQKVLTTYAQTTGYTAANPGPIDGKVGLKTAGAVVAMLPRTPGIPSEVSTLAPVIWAFAQYDQTQADKLFALIRKHASSIAKAVIAIGIHNVATGGGVPQPPTPGGGKASWALVSDYAQTPGAVWAPPSMTTPDGGGGPLAPTKIWFYDGWKRVYRVAVPQGTLAGEYKDYVEIAPSESRPASGTEVSRSTFMSATGRWWMTTLGMVAMGAGALALGGAAFYGARAVLR